MPPQRTTPQPRLIDEDGFTLVCSRRRKPQAAAEAPSAPEFRRYLLAGQEGDSPFQAVRRLEQAYPDLRVRVTERRGEAFLTPKDEEASFCLARLCREGSSLGVRLQEADVKSRGVVLRYPLSHSLEPLQQHPCVTFAKRCLKRTGHGRTEPTRQVVVELTGQLPSSLNLGYWGCYSVRRFTPEPLRCFKCQGFGHVQKHCERRELCGVCSQGHPTSECIRALKEGSKPEACCPNCGGRHHVWAPHCPERLRRLPPGARGKVRDTQLVSVSPAGPHTRSRPPTRPVDPPPAPPSVPATTGKRKRRRRRRRARRATAQPIAPVEASAQPVLSPPKVTAAATQATPEVAHAATETDKAILNFCRCDLMTIVNNVQRVFKIFQEEQDTADTVVRDLLQKVITIVEDQVLVPVEVLGIGKMPCEGCEGNCPTDDEETEEVCVDE